ncbi:MAG: YXWGXW repeat-containing protein [Steroidobacteraceae bacterium]
MNTRILASLLGACLLPLGSVVSLPAHASVSVGVSITLAPPELPVYEQPPLPAPGYLWMPGYWAYGPDGYYWVPGTWVLPPRVGYLWTPGYWGWSSGFYFWHAGYWGPSVGFYGGINYGYGYFGVGYQGGYWRGDRWYYNRACNRFDDRVHVTNVYERTVVNNITVNRVSYHGGRGGIERAPLREELSAARGPHLRLTPDQRRHEIAAGHDREFLASVNRGRPALAATARPAMFDAHARGQDSHSRGQPARLDRPPGAQGGFGHDTRSGQPRIDRPGGVERMPAARAARIGPTARIDRRIGLIRGSALQHRSPHEPRAHGTVGRRSGADATRADAARAGGAASGSASGAVTWRSGRSRCRTCTGAAWSRGAGF